MSELLSDRQQQELHISILDYLYSAGLIKTYEQLRQEAPGFTDFQADPDTKSSGLLVKKWMSVIRMQKKIMELETKLAQALEEVSHVGHLSAGGTKHANKDWLPTGHPKHALSGHRDKVNAVSFHPTYSVFASAGADAAVKIWDWDSGELERTLKGHTKSVTDCDFDSAGKYLATSSYDLFIKLWNVHDDYKNFATLRGHEHSISSVRFLPGDNRIASSSRDQSVRVWDVQTTHCIKVLQLHQDWIRSALPSCDGRLILTCSDDHTTRITDLESAATKAEMRGHDNVVEVAVFVPSISIPAVRDLVAIPASAQTSKIDSMGVTFVATGSRDKTVRIWDGLRGQCLWTFFSKVGHDNWVRALVFHPSGKYLLSAADDGTIRIWDLKTGRCMKKVEAHSPFVQCLAWGRVKVEGQGDADGTVNVVATGGTDKLVKIWHP
ncbi:hypothetical protein PILCRDRAFT_830134 [Piloderma croceum F 1598]|uniref:Nuclear distribution protein PAC1 n=1 Tax=Piloderma croceum (strain F 1598) TaxID=765440 RepID=A0A0C3B3B4_PILCF|nr:hypothetical protein PILCRDRAFT_830134 [Piloderma croceum F 1598]